MEASSVVGWAEGYSKPHCFHLPRASDQGPELALRFLLRHSQWSEAICLLQQVGADTSQRTSLFFLLLQHLLQVCFNHLVKAQVLPVYFDINNLLQLKSALMVDFVKLC